MELNDITYTIRGCIFEVYNNLGPGLLEGVYEEALCFEMTKCGLEVSRQADIQIIYKGQKLNKPLRLDILVNNSVILELKSVDVLTRLHFKQLQTYLKLTGCKVGLLINFNTIDIVKDIHRIAMGPLNS